MPTRTDNRIVLDLNKIAYAWHFYRNQWGDTLKFKPDVTTVSLRKVEDEYAWPHDYEYPGEKAIERAKRLGLIDKWTPVFRCRMSAADVLEFTGPKAVSLWKAWNEKQFNGGKK